MNPDIKTFSNDGSFLLFDSHFGITEPDIKKILSAALSSGGDFAELFFEYRMVSSMHMEEDLLKESSEYISMGTGVRVLKGDQTGYAYTNEPVPDKIRQAARIAAAIAGGTGSVRTAGLSRILPPSQTYDIRLPMHELEFNGKYDLVHAANLSARKFDSCIEHVQVTLADEIRSVTIANSEGLFISDIRPQMRMAVRATARKNSRRNTGLCTGGGRVGLHYFKDVATPESIGEKAANEAVTLLSAADPPAGEWPVVLGCEHSGVMIHEAVGHPLEADANRKKMSIMWDKLGKQVAGSIVTIYDDPTLPHLRGSLNIDDEGTVPVRSVLIEKGKLVGFLQDRLSAKLMNMNPNGHGRRGSYQNIPIPRMANTILARGDADPDDIIRSVSKGFYAKSFQGGQVQDSGKFTFSVNLGFLIENGKLTQPVKNATLIGTNVQILNEVELIGNDMGFFLGTCGKDGQSAPVTAGTPTLKIRKMTVGGR